MNSKQISISDTFEDGTCSLCGNNEISQFFGINDNFIEFCGVFYSFREILADALDYNINHTEGKLMEICLDCKDKVIKFYHFKRKIKEIQKFNLHSGYASNKSSSKEKRSKIVQNIYQIIENYTEKCSTVQIKVHEDSKKLVIESAGEDTNSQASKTERNSLKSCESYFVDSFNPSPSVVIKEEYNEEDTPSVIEKDNFDESSTSSSSLPEESTSQGRKKRKISYDESYDPRNRNDRKNKSKSKETTICEVSGKEIPIIETPEALEEFHNLIFPSKTMGLFRKNFEVYALRSNPKFVKSKLNDTKFSKVSMYRVKCKICSTLIWTHTNTIILLQRHLQVHSETKVKREKQKNKDDTETDSDCDELEIEEEQNKHKPMKVPKDFTIENFQDVLFKNRHMDLNKYFKVSDVKFNGLISTVGMMHSKFPYITSYTLQCLGCNSNLSGRFDNMSNIRRHYHHCRKTNSKY